MRYIYQSVYNHTGRWLQSGCSERKTQEICRLTFIGILIYNFHVLKFRISLEFFFLSVQTVAIYLHGCRHSGIYIAFNLFILHNFPRNITPFHSPNYFQYIFSILTHFSVNRIIKIDSEHICYQYIARPPLATYK